MPVPEASIVSTIPTRTTRRRAALPWLLVAVIVLGGVVLRLAATMRLPLFIDEAIHLGRAHRVVDGYIFFGENIRHIRKWLYPVTLALFRPIGPEGPWLARSLSALCGALSMAACIALARTIGGWRAGLLAGLLYAVLPLAVFHERQALADPEMAAFAAVSLVLTVRLTIRPRLPAALLLGLTLAAACLAKLAALPFLLLPPAAAILLSRGRRVRWRSLAFAALALALSVALIAAVYTRFVHFREAGGTAYQVTRDNVNLLLKPGPGAKVAPRLSRDLPAALAILLHYVGWAALALVVLSFVWPAPGKKRRFILFLLIPALLFALVPIVAVRPAEILAPRYFLINAAPLAVTTALSLSLALTWLDARLPTLGRWAGVALLLAALGPALWFDACLIHDPSRAPLAPADRTQYVDGKSSGYGHAELAAALLDAWRAGNGEQILVLSTGSPVWLEGYLGPRVGAFDSFRPWDDLQVASLPPRLAHDQVYLLEESKSGLLPESPLGMRIVPIAEFESGVGPLSLFRVVGVEGDLAPAVYAELTPDPTRLAEDYVALSTALSSDATPRPVVVFPASHASALPAANLDVRPLAVNVWPADLASVNAALSALNLGGSRQPVEVVLVDEAATDPDLVLRLALQRRLYRLDEEWFGLLHRLTYVTGLPDPPLTSEGARFEGGIELTGAALLDRQVNPGDFVRVALTWQTPTPIGDSFHVFVHVVGADEALVAQHDAVPGGGLLPMPSWQPGQPVEDRLAIRLPADLEPGVYQVRVGIYHPDSGLRLPVAAGEEVGPGYVVIGHLSVEEGGA